MIKGPYKYDEHTLFITKLFGFIFALIAVALKTRIGEWTIIINIPSVIVAALIYAVFYAVGQGMAYRTRVLLHTPVNTQIINPHAELQVDRTYYINGSTPVSFYHNDSENSGSFIFLLGENREKVYLTPREVKTYISKIKES